MAYTDYNFPSKKALKEAVKNGTPVRLSAWPVPSFYGYKNGTKQTCVEGPHYPQPHRWYATVTVNDDGIIVGVK